MKTRIRLVSLLWEVKSFLLQFSFDSSSFIIWQIVDCNALPTLILMLRSENAAIHYEAVGLLLWSNFDVLCYLLLSGNLVHIIRWFFGYLSGWSDWKSGPFISKHKERSTSCRSIAACYWLIEVPLNFGLLVSHMWSNPALFGKVAGNDD